MITDIWRHQAGKYFCISTKSQGGRWHDEFFARDELDEVASYVRDHRDRNVYWCPHGLNRRHRCKSNAVLPTLLWADIDGGVDPRKLDLRPTVAIESSPGRYVCLWECDGVVSEDLNQRLTYHIGADKGGWDLSQVLRAPGTINYKYASKPRARLLWNDGPTHRVSELERLLPKKRERKRKRLAATRSPVSLSGWRKLTGKELACEQFDLEPNLFGKRWNKRFIVIIGVWMPMVKRGASLAMIMHALDDCPAWHSKVAEHGDAWKRREIEKINGELEK